ncbi:haloacid dehalogenase [Lentinula raphanica]|nr:haloacid dehalogenase [Lentinula raphanica]
MQRNVNFASVLAHLQVTTMSESSQSTAKLTDFKVLVFDVYGTLADWETGIYLGLKPMLNRYAESSQWSRKQALEAYSAVESDLQAKYPHLLYADLLSKVHELMEERLRAASGLPVKTSTGDGDPSYIPDRSGASTSNQAEPSRNDEHAIFGQSIRDWPIFPDSHAALHALSEHYKLVVLFNVDRQSFAHTLAKLSEGPTSEFSPDTYAPPDLKDRWYPKSNPKSKSPFTLILTAQDVQSYKPALRGFEVALDDIHQDPALRHTPKHGVLWVAQSQFHDLEPVSRLGVKSVFIDRQGATMGFSTSTPPYSWRFETLGAMADAVAKEFKQ